MKLLDSNNTLYFDLQLQFWGFPGGSVIGDAGLIPLLGKSPGGGNGSSLQYSCLGNPMERGAWQASPWGPKESDTLWGLSMHTYVNMVW